MITVSDRGYWLIGLVVMVGIAGQWMPGPWSVVTAQIWALPAALLVAAVYAERAALPALRLDISRRVPDTARLGENFTITLLLANHGPRTVMLECQPSWPDSISAEARITRYRVAAGETVSDDSVLRPLALGTLRPGDLHTRTLGFLGLVWWHRRVEYDAAIRVVPRSYHTLSRRTGDRLSGTALSRRPAQGGMEFLAHRAYQQGDPLQGIDWKATARSHEVMVRIMAREQRMEMAILLDCGRRSRLLAGNLSLLHHNVNVVARLSELAVSHGDHIACVTYADRPLAMMALDNGIRGLKSARELLAQTQSVDAESNLLAAALQARRLLGHRALVVVLTDLSSGDDASQFSRAVRLLGARHRVVIASIDDPQIRRMRWMQASHWIDPYRSLAAIEYCRERELTASKMQQHGAAVISAAPDKLDGAVLDHYRQLRQRVAV